MQVILDQEGRCLELKFFTPSQIEDIRRFFIQILREDKSVLDFNDFSSFIGSLLGPNQPIDQILLQEFFKLYDYNGDHQLDWNKYLGQFVASLQKQNYIKTLKMLPLIQLQKRYLSLLQIENLISPISQQYQLNQVQLQLLELEKQIPSLLQIKGCYFLCTQEIIIADGLLPQPAPIIMQSLLSALLSDQLSAIRSLVDLLTLMVQQRCPHQLSAIGNYYIPLIQALASQYFMDVILTFLDDQDSSELVLYTLQYLTLLVYGVTVYNLKQLFVGLFPQIFQQLKSQSVLVKYQALLCMSQLIMYDHSTIDWCHQNDIHNELMNLQNLYEDKQLLFYQSWLLSCLAGRFELGQLEQFVVRMNHPDYGQKSKEWIVEVRKYTKQIIDLYPIYDQDPLTIQILVNILQLNTPLLCTPNTLKFLWDILLLAINSTVVNQTVKQQALLTIKKIFIQPIKLDFDNGSIQIYLLQGGLIQDLLFQTASGDLILRQSALKLLFSSLSVKCALLVSRYIEETKIQSQFLSLVMQLYVQITNKIYPDGHAEYKLLIWKALIALANKDGQIFQILSTDQLLFVQLMQLIEAKGNEVSLAMFQNKSKFYDLSEDHNVWILSGIYFDLYLKHFQNIFHSSQQQQYNIIEQVMPNKITMELIAQYLEYLFNNMKSFRPLLIKKYLKDIYSNVLNCIFTIGQFTTQLSELCVRVNAPNIFCLEVQSQLDLTLKVYQNYANRSQEIENLLILAGSQDLIKEGNVITVHLNQYASQQQSKLVLYKQMTLLDFEKQIEKGLLIRQPMIYLIINQNDPLKSLHEQTIIGELTFEKFKYHALQMIETQVGCRMIPQEIIAVDLYKLKYKDEFTMKRLFQIMRNGTKYFELISIKKNSLLWLDTNNLNFNDERAVLQLLAQETQMNYYQLDNLYKSIVNFLQQRGIVMLNFFINTADFVDFLAMMGVPYSFGIKLSTFLSKQGVNVDYRDFVCFLACVQANQEDNLILKLVYLVYMEPLSGAFGYQQVENYLRDMIAIIYHQAIQKSLTSEEQIKEWALELMAYLNYNKEGQISYFEFHALLRHPQFRARLLDPLQQLLNQLTQQRPILNHTHLNLPVNFFQNNPLPVGSGFNPSMRRQYGQISNGYFYND